MAAERRNEEVAALLTCPVCLDRYRDPRMLSCAHQFCLTCLEGILRGDAENGEGPAAYQPAYQPGVSCPTCRANTSLPQDTGVAGLPRPILMIDAQEVIQGLLEGNRGAELLACDLCDLPDVTADWYCYSCDDLLCEICYGEHQERVAECEHRMVRACAELFCKSHTAVLSVYCATYRKPICDTCASKAHRKHVTEELSAVCGEARGRLSEFVLREDSGGACLAPVREKVSETLAAYGSMLDRLDRAYTASKRRFLAVRAARHEARDRRRENVAALRAYEHRLSCAADNRGRAISTAKRLLVGATDPELVVRAEALLDPGQLPSIAGLIPPDVVLPREKPLLRLLCELEGLAEAEPDLVVYRPSPLHTAPTAGDYTVTTLEEHDGEHASTEGVVDTETLTGTSCSDGSPAVVAYQPTNVSPLLTVTFKTRCACAVVLDAEREELVLRTYDPAAALVVYDTAGNCVRTLGKTHPYSSRAGGLDLDTHRKWYLVPHREVIYQVELAGNLAARLTLPNRFLYAVAFLPHRDLYAVTDEAAPEIIMVTPDLGTPVHVIRLTSPCYSISGLSSSGTDVLAACDLTRQKVDRFEVDGSRMVSLESGEGTVVCCSLYAAPRPWGPHGGLLVLQRDVSGRLRLWVEGDAELHPLTLTEAHTCRATCALAVDRPHRRLALLIDNQLHLYTWTHVPVVPGAAGGADITLTTTSTTTCATTTTSDAHTVLESPRGGAITTTTTTSDAHTALESPRGGGITTTDIMRMNFQLSPLHQTRPLL